MKVKERACGKVILFGEHTVVYSGYALAASIDLFAEVELRRSLSKKTYNSPIKDILERFSKDYGVKTDKLKINIKNEIPKGCGSGSAIACALTKALHKYFNIELNDEKLIDYVNFSDSITHGGKVSGIDAYTVVKGGFVYAEEGKFSQVDVNEPLELVVCDSGVRAQTKKQIEKLEKYKQENEELFRLSNAAITTFAVTTAEFLLSPLDKETIGHFMYENHEILKDMGLSCKELDEIVEFAKEGGELGAKLTGAGGGGAAIILSENPKELVEELKKKGYKAFIVRLGISKV